jgi:hypothetical protein
MARIATVKYDATHGLYHRTLGMDANGRKPKFWLGADRPVAERRVERLELLWSQVEQDWSTLPDEYPDWLESRLITKPERPLWDELTLAAARRIAKGETTFPLARKPSWSPYQYTMRLANSQRRFSAIQFVPDEREEEYHRIGTELVHADARSEIDAAHDTLAAVAGHAGQSLHQVFDAYIVYLSKLPDRSGWYKTQTKQTQRLKAHHADIPLAQFGLNKVQELIDFWRHRPTLRGKAIAVTTARNHIIQLDMILKWLERNEEFKWQRPRLMDDLKRTVKDDEYRPPQVETFSVADLTALYTYASPLVRLEMLLALNCGFKYAEIASLALGEIHLQTPYPGIVRVDRPEGLGDWLIRFRRKTKVYGEWKLWSETVAGIEWAKAHRSRPAHSPADTLLVTRSGLALDQRTSGGNKSDKIMKSWTHLYKAVPEGKAKYLSFKHLEKTATDWIRNHFGGEVGSLFACHGKPVKTDAQLEAYSNKPFLKLFTALDQLREYLRPMFAAVAGPWATRPRTSPDKLERIRVLRSEGKTLVEIAAEVGLHWVTVGKLCRKNAASG